MVKKKYFQEGEQTQITSLVMEHVEKIKQKKAKLSFRGVPVDARGAILASYRVCEHIFSLPYISGWKKDEENKRLRKAIFRKRNLHTILEEGLFPTCSDMAVLFRGLMIAQKFSTAYVESFHEDFLFGREVSGHVFGRVFYNGKSIIINPDKVPEFYVSEKSLFVNKKYIIFREGLDSWDVGIKGEGDRLKLRNKYLGKLREKYWELCDATSRISCPK